MSIVPLNDDDIENVSLLIGFKIEEKIFSKFLTSGIKN